MISNEELNEIIGCSKSGYVFPSLIDCSGQRGFAYRLIGQATQMAHELLNGREQYQELTLENHGLQKQLEKSYQELREQRLHNDNLALEHAHYKAQCENHKRDLSACERLNDEILKRYKDLESKLGSKDEELLQRREEAQSFDSSSRVSTERLEEMLHQVGREDIKDAIKDLLGLRSYVAHITAQAEKIVEERDDLIKQLENEKLVNRNLNLEYGDLNNHRFATSKELCSRTIECEFLRNERERLNKELKETEEELLKLNAYNRDLLNRVIKLQGERARVTQQFASASFDKQRETDDLKKEIERLKNVSGEQHEEITRLQCRMASLRVELMRLDSNAWRGWQLNLPPNFSARCS